jgi:hypothetical protein
MAEKKVIKLEELINLVDDFIKGDKTQEELADYGANMDVRAYLTLLDKMKIVMGLTTSYVYSDAELHEVRIAELYRDLFFYGLLGGYAMIDCSDRKLCTFENYDKLFPIFNPFLTSYCGADFEVLKEFLHDALDSYATRDFVEAINGISTEELKNAAEENRKLLEGLDKNKDIIHELKEIAAMNNPLMKKVVDELRAISIENTMEQKNTDQ